MGTNHEVKLGDANGKPIRFEGGQQLHLANLAEVMVMAAEEPSQKHFDELINICNSIFDPVSKSKVHLMQQLDTNHPLGQIPHYDQSHYGRFTGSGSMGSANIQGIMELIFRDDTWIQFGIQLRINKVLGMFGGSKSLERVIEDLSAASFQINSSPDAVQTTTVNDTTIKTTANDKMYNYLSVNQENSPLVTWRVGNRDEWDDFAI